MAVAEAPIDALSLAALEAVRPDALYVATGSGVGPGAVEALKTTLRSLSAMPRAVMCSATDANAAGDRYAPTTPSWLLLRGSPSSG